MEIGVRIQADEQGNVTEEYKTVIVDGATTTERTAVGYRFGWLVR